MTNLRSWLLAAAAAVLAFVVFIPTLDNEFVDWDDTGVLTENEDYRGLGGEQLRWMFTTNHYGHYQPITWLTYGFDYVLWGMNPTGYHLTNNLFHAANTLLVFWLALAFLRRATGDGAPGAAGAPIVEIAALVAALLFGLHPLRVESVAWATERRDLVSAFFLLLTLLAYVRWAAPGPRRLRWLGVSLVLYVVSMLSKVGGAPLPFVLLVLDWYPLRRLSWPAVLEKLPFLVVAITFSAATIGQQTGKWLYPLADHDLVARTAQAFYGLVFYAMKTAVPINLLPLYELRMPLNPFAPMFVASVVIVVGAAVGLYLLRRRCPGALAAGLCYALMLGPLLGFFQNGPQIVADRYSYLSCLGWLVLAAGGVWWVLSKGPRAGRIGVGVATVVLLGALSLSTWRQSNVWQSTATLWRYVVVHDPESSNANNSHGYVLMSQYGEVETAVGHFYKALEINPKNGEAWFNLWDALRDLEREPELIAALHDGAASPRADINASAWYRLGNIYYGRRAWPEAIDAYERSLRIRADARAYTNLSLALSYLSAQTEAVAWGRAEQYAREAILVDPGLINARLALIRALNGQQRRADALAATREALRVAPQNRTALEWLQRLQ